MFFFFPLKPFDILIVKQKLLFSFKNTEYFLLYIHFVLHYWIFEVKIIFFILSLHGGREISGWYTKYYFFILWGETFSKEILQNMPIIIQVSIVFSAIITNAEINKEKQKKKLFIFKHYKHLRMYYSWC